MNVKMSLNITVMTCMVIILCMSLHMMYRYSKHFSKELVFVIVNIIIIVLTSVNAASSRKN